MCWQMIITYNNNNGNNENDHHDMFIKMRTRTRTRTRTWERQKRTRRSRRTPRRKITNVQAHSHTATKHTEEIPPPKPWGGLGADQASCEPAVVLAHQDHQDIEWLHIASFGSFSWLSCDAQINGLSNLVCMFIGRVAHQLFQIVDSVSQCSMLLQRALGGKELPKRLTDAEFEKFEA